MDHRGFFPLWRKITEWGWYKDSNTKAVFLHLLLTANHRDSNFMGHEIKEGQCVHGLIELSKILGMSFQSIRTSIKHLKSTNEITTEATNKFTIYTLTNYFKYVPKNAGSNKPANKQLTNDQQTTNKQLTTSNNNKNDNNDIRIKYSDFVYLTTSEYDSLKASWGESNLKHYIERMNDYIGSKGVKYKSHYHALKAWYRKDHPGEVEDNRPGYLKRDL